ncbi:hypothetical protein C2S52_023634 [Perilla frutescens var. hirtella]|nr:hypothetical protein C2S52_023634 [Perilla frutescens var. hirtella]
MVEIRKNRREENLQKKRREGIQQFPVPVEATTGIEKKVQLENLPSMVASVWTDDASQQLEATSQFRKLLSIERSPPIQEVIQSGVVPRFVQFLTREDYPQLQFEAAWALTNIASGTSEHTKVVIDHGAVPIFVQLLGFSKQVLRFQFSDNFIDSTDEEFLTDACWALSYLSDGSNDKIQAVIDSGVCRRLVELLHHPSPSVLIPALRTVGNIVTRRMIYKLRKALKKKLAGLFPTSQLENRDQIQAIIEAGIIGPLIQLLQNAEFDVKKEAAWALSNANLWGTHEQIQYLVSQQCIKPLCDLLVCPDQGSSRYAWKGSKHFESR